jgi:hypothetical protein
LIVFVLAGCKRSSQPRDAAAPQVVAAPDAGAPGPAAPPDDPGARVVASPSARCIVRLARRSVDAPSLAEIVSADEPAETARLAYRVPGGADDPMDQYTPPLPADPERAQGPDESSQVDAFRALRRLDRLRQRAGDAAAPVSALVEALATQQPVDDAVAAVVDALHGDVADATSAVVLEIVDRADTVGGGPGLAPLRRRLLELANATRDPAFRHQQLARIYYAALRTGADADEVAAIEAALAAKDAPGHAAERTAALRTLATGSLEDALAVAREYQDADPEDAVWPMAIVWGRHVTAGFDAGFEARLAEVACGALDGCFTHDLARASLGVTVAGAVDGDRVVVAASAIGDPDAVARQLTPRCRWPDPRLALLVGADADPAALLAVIRGALAAGFEEVAAVDDRPGGRSCTIRRAAAAAADQVHLSILLEPRVAWIGQSRIGDEGRFAHDAVAGEIQQIGASAYFFDRPDAEIAVGPGAGPAALAAFWPVCERFPELRIVEPDALTARPAR